MNLASSINELSQTEIINETDSIAATLANLTTPMQGPLYANEIDLVVTTVSALNEYV